MASADDRAAAGFFEHKGSDGALIQVTAADGYVTVLQNQASTFGRGAALMTIEEAEALAGGITAAVKVAKGQEEDAELKATPAAVAHADELGVDLNAVQGSGKDGTITKADVASHAASTAA